MTQLLNNIKDPLAVINETRGKGKGGKGREGGTDGGREDIEESSQKRNCSIFT